MHSSGYNIYQSFEELMKLEIQHAKAFEAEYPIGSEFRCVKNYGPFKENETCRFLKTREFGIKGLAWAMGVEFEDGKSVTFREFETYFIPV